MNNYEIVSSEGFYYVMNSNGADEAVFTTLEEAEEYIRQQEE